MRTLLILAAGVWLGRRISAVLSEHRNRERELTLRKRLEALMSEHLASMPAAETQERIKTFFK